MTVDLFAASFICRDAEPGALWPAWLAGAEPEPKPQSPWTQARERRPDPRAWAAIAFERLRRSVFGARPV